MPVHAIIAALSLHRFVGGKIEVNKLKNHVNTNHSLRIVNKKFEIIFKLKVNGSSTVDYQFLASEITGISFTHKRNNTASSGFYNGKFSIENYSIDTDEDTIVDYLDLDSDGDGCSDVIEAGFLDQDSNGIDDNQRFSGCAGNSR